jgi:hypothetical protein
MGWPLANPSIRGDHKQPHFIRNMLFAQQLYNNDEVSSFFIYFTFLKNNAEHISTVEQLLCKGYTNNISL